MTPLINESRLKGRWRSLFDRWIMYGRLRWTFGFYCPRVVRRESIQLLPFHPSLAIDSTDKRSCWTSPWPLRCILKINMLSRWTLHQRRHLWTQVSWINMDYNFILIDSPRSRRRDTIRNQHSYRTSIDTGVLIECDDRSTSHRCITLFDHFRLVDFTELIEYQPYDDNGDNDADRWRDSRIIVEMARWRWSKPSEECERRDTRTTASDRVDT